jgi:hypothetical protein
VIRDGLNENNINFLYSVMEVVHIPINFRLRGIGIDKITLSKNYFIIEFEDGNNIFIDNYTKYDDIYGEIEELDAPFITSEIISEILEFLEDESQLIKKIIKNFRSWNR